MRQHRKFYEIFKVYKVINNYSYNYTNEMK